MAEQIGAAPTACVAVEDSANGIRTAHAAGTAVVAVPNSHYQSPVESLALASVTVDGVAAAPAQDVRQLGTSQIA